MEAERKVEIISKTKSIKIPKTEYINFALDVMEKVALFGEITILLCGEKKIKELNKRYRQKNCVTDVISFSYQNSLVFIGDIVICPKVAKENSKRFGHSFELEMKKLVVHAILHLIGYDHNNDKGKMARKEKNILKSLGVHF